MPAAASAISGINVNISDLFQDYTGIKAFYFNPSIAKIIDNLYLVSARSYIHLPSKKWDTNPDLHKNKQHPWGTSWDGKDYTLICPARLTKDRKLEMVKNCKKLGYPLNLPFQDLRIFRFIQLENKIVFILTFNERYEGHTKTVIKGGDVCDDYCYLIGWGYLIVDAITLEFGYVPGSEPLCPNISNPVEKNWSLWRHDDKNTGLIELLCSYNLSPIHSVFSLKLINVTDGEINADSSCKMLTHRQIDIDQFLHTFEHLNFFRELEKYYDNNLFVSLSTPAYPVNGDPKSNVYQAVGHLKIKRHYLKKVPQSKKLYQLVNQIKDYKYLNPNYIYLMFIYRFKVETTYHHQDKKDKNTNRSDLGAVYIDNFVKINAEITQLSPAFLHQPDRYNYYLNFPSGMVIDNHTNETIISYGDGDKTSNLLFIDNKVIEKNLYNLKKLKPANYSFLGKS